MALTSSLMPSFHCSLRLFSCNVERWRLWILQDFALLMDIELWSYEAAIVFFGFCFFYLIFFPQRNREEVSRQIYRACDGIFIGHVMRTCTCCRAVVTSSVPVPLRFGEDCFSLFLVCPSLLMQRREIQRNNKLSLSCNWNVKAAVIPS